MKRKLFLLLALLVPSFIWAGSLTREQALQYAQDFFALRSSEGLSVVWTGDNTAEPAFYAINNAQGGFIILSGEECADPIVGYSRDGSFQVKGMPEHMRSFFKVYEDDVKYLRKNLSREVSLKTKAKWENLGLQTKAGGEFVLETATWDQGYPYNNECYVTGTTKAVTGCVATALAIYCRYMKYPAHGTGTLPSYTTSSERYSIAGYSIDDHVYDWDIMPLKNADVQKASAEAKAAIAQIMHDCGVMLKMDYAPSASGAFTQYIVEQAPKYLGYCKDARFLRKALYSTEEWLAVMTDAINEGRPIIFSGQDANGGGGHCFIISGYDGQGHFYVNWGWSGSSNGFYSLDLNVEGYRFRNNCGALVGLVPDPDATSGDANYDLQISGNSSGKGLVLNNGHILKDQSFALGVKYVVNWGYGAYNGALVGALVDEQGNVKEIISASTPFSIDAASYNSGKLGSAEIFCKITSDIDFSDKVVVLYQIPGTSPMQWELLRHNREEVCKGSIPAIPYTFIKVKDSYAVGDILTFELIDGADGYNSVEWYLDGVKNTSGTATLTSGKHVITAILNRADGKETINQEITVK